MPDEQQALWHVARDKAAQIVAGEVSPYDGAAWIWWNVCDSIEREGDLRIFIGRASEWEDHPAYRSEIERAIVADARALLEKPHLRLWVKLQAEEGCWPLWEPRNRNLGRDGLPLSVGLNAALGSWAADFDRVRQKPGRGPSGFTDQPAAEDFVERGRRLTAQLQDELGNEWHVEYMQTASAFPPSAQQQGERGS